jgi:hypothetical protein
MSTKVLQNQKYQTCIDACNACAESCELCATSCLREQDVKMLERCIQLDRDCATICWTASQFMSRDSEYVKEICNTCAKLCVTHALKSVKNMQDTWSIANSALKSVVNALKSIVEWEDKNL